MIPGVNKETRLLYKLSIWDPDNSWSRVWKGIFGIRDLIEIQCGIGKNATFFDCKRDLTATQEAEFAKFLARDAVLGKKTLFGTQMTLEVRDAGLDQPNRLTRSGRGSWSRIAAHFLKIICCCVSNVNLLPFSLKIPLFQRVDFAFNNQLKTTVFNDYLQITQTGF